MGDIAVLFHGLQSIATKIEQDPKQLIVVSVNFQGLWYLVLPFEIFRLVHGEQFGHVFTYPVEGDQAAIRRRLVGFTVGQDRLSVADGPIDTANKFGSQTLYGWIWKC